MMDVDELINEAITVMASRPSVFSAQDVANYADLDSGLDAVGNALQARCRRGEVLLLDERKASGEHSRHHLSREQAERWWVDSTLRWARAGVLQLPTAKLADEMSMTFDAQRWSVVPHRLLSVGRRFALVADGSQPDTFVFPWAAVIRASPGFATRLHPCIVYLREQVLSGEPQHRFSDINLRDAVEQILATLSNREADILKGRLGIENGQSLTLEKLGRKHSVTRERIRQVETKAWRKLRHPTRSGRIWNAFAMDFVQSDGRLAIPDEELTPWHQLIYRVIDLPTVQIAEIGLHFIGKDTDFAEYRKALTAIDPQRGASRNLDFLSRQDEVLVNGAELRHITARVKTKRAYMLREGLRSLGRAAHYEEIAHECNRLFPERSNTVHNWHAALSLSASPEREELGIVWIGVKGTYGLKEHGYSRPDSDLFTQVAEIVERIHGWTNKPVSEAVVISELSSLRREWKITSVKMALGINERLKAVSGGFIPKEPNITNSSDTETSSYDIDAAFAAFVGHPSLNANDA